jgi:hypothetical protein
MSAHGTRPGVEEGLRVAGQGIEVERAAGPAGESPDPLLRPRLLTIQCSRSDAHLPAIRVHKDRRMPAEPTPQQLAPLSFSGSG